ncbi:MAG: response regulator [Treponema sp.]|jgi:CheY-like chemotaxis protein|nr:response regulator [Treponema sp.]
MEDKKTILAIDDNKMDLMVLSNFLSQKYDLRLLKSGGDALVFLNTTTVDIILLDIAMPSMSGFEFLHELRKNPKQMQIPVIVVSSYGTPDFVEYAKKKGADDCLSKPVNAEILQQKIEKVLKTPSRAGLLAGL